MTTAFPVARLHKKAGYICDMTTARLLLLGALPEELAAYAAHVVDGRWCGVAVDLALTGVGKSAAAAATQRGIDVFRPDAIIFTGVAGSLDPARSIGDIGIGVAAIDADFDIRAWRPGSRRGEMPFTGERLWASDPLLVRTALAAPVPRLFSGFIATGSAFLDAPGKARFRRDVLPDLADTIDGVERQPDLIEMEGSAVLQTAHANRIPALAIRAVSDDVEGDAVADFHAFICDAVHAYVAVVEHVLRSGAIRKLAG